jgi:hypothetical protein
MGWVRQKPKRKSRPTQRQKLGGAIEIKEFALSPVLQG